MARTNVWIDIWIIYCPLLIVQICNATIYLDYGLDKEDKIGRISEVQADIRPFIPRPCTFGKVQVAKVEGLQLKYRMRITHRIEHLGGLQQSMESKRILFRGILLMERKNKYAEVKKFNLKNIKLN